MRWYFAIDEDGGLSETGVLARLAVLSARRVGGLEPVLLYFGARTEFTAWMEAQGVRVVDTAPSFQRHIEQAAAAGTYRPHSMGHWLRVAVPQVEQEREFVLYTDCDVIFRQRCDFSIVRPKVFAAAPEFHEDNWSYFNAGIMVMNVPAMRATYPAFEAHVTERIGQPGYDQYDDEAALNAVYAGLWERLDPAFNWKPYWRLNAAARILHFHGPKPSVLEAIAAGAWHGRDETAVVWEHMLKARFTHYLAWCESLGDGLQDLDFPAALRFGRLAAALTAYRRAHMAEGDTSYMNVKVFAR
jgi:hypothetical protein